MHYILLDEVQMASEFEDVLNGFLHIPNADTYVTGSNAKFLSKDIVTEFRGRGDQIHLYPLTFSEFFRGYDGSREEGMVEHTERTAGQKMRPLLSIKDSFKKIVVVGVLQPTYMTDDGVLVQNLFDFFARRKGILNTGVAVRHPAPKNCMGTGQFSVKN